PFGARLWRWTKGPFLLCSKWLFWSSRAGSLLRTRAFTAFILSWWLDREGGFAYLSRPVRALCALSRGASRTAWLGAPGLWRSIIDPRRPHAPAGPTPRARALS